MARACPRTDVLATMAPSPPNSSVQSPQCLSGQLSSIRSPPIFSPLCKSQQGAGVVGRRKGLLKEGAGPKARVVVKVHQAAAQLRHRVTALLCVALIT